MRDDEIKGKLKDISELYGLRVSKTKGKVKLQKPQFINIDISAIESIDESKDTFIIKTRPDVVDITVWKKVPAMHTQLFKFKRDLKDRVGV